MVSRAIGYNGLVIAIIGDGINPVLIAYVTGEPQASMQEPRYEAAKLALLLAVSVPAFGLPSYLYCRRERSPKPALAEGLKDS